MAIDLSIPVIVVDDVPAMTRIIKALLGEIGFTEIDEAADGETALARIRERRHGLVVSDLNMAPVSGLDLLRQLRAEPGLSRTPFLMVTADAKPHHAVAAKKAGVDGYMMKPFDAAMLRDKIGSVLD